MEGLMNKFLVKWTICDGEHEYNQVAVFEAQDIKQAKEIAHKDYATIGYEGDYRIYKDVCLWSISEGQYNVLRGVL